MKLTENNARFAVVKTAFHNGGAVSFHNSLEAAMKAKKKLQRGECVCGCADVVPVTIDAQNEIVAARDRWNNPIYTADSAPALYADLPEFGVGGRVSPYALCR
jgi:hypothetical protein